jgi:hypothetical protein
MGIAATRYGTYCFESECGRIVANFLSLEKNNLVSPRCIWSLMIIYR